MRQLSSDNPFPTSAGLTAGQSELKDGAQSGSAFPWGLLAGASVSEWGDVDKDSCAVNGNGEVVFG